MGDVRLTIGVAACLVALATGCAKTSVGQVQEVGPGIYSIGIGVSRGLGGTSQEQKALGPAIDKAGDYCHSKGQKLLITAGAANNSITFRCIS